MYNTRRSLKYYQKAVIIASFSQILLIFSAIYTYNWS